MSAELDDALARIARLRADTLKGLAQRPGTYRLPGNCRVRAGDPRVILHVIDFGEARARLRNVRAHGRAANPGPGTRPADGPR